MRAKNLDDSAPGVNWVDVEARLNEGLDQAPETGGPNRHTSWLTTINPDGSPHVTAVGALWLDGAFWFQTGDPTRKAKNLARDPRCAIAVATHEMDLTIEGAAHKVSDPSVIADLAARWAAGGWPCEVDESGVGLTAPFNAPAVGPPPWFVYRITPRAATVLGAVEPGGATRFEF